MAPGKDRRQAGGSGRQDLGQRGCLPAHLLRLFSARQVSREHRALLWRPLDMALVTYLAIAGFFTLFRGLVSAPC